MPEFTQVEQVMEWVNAMAVDQPPVWNPTPAPAEFLPQPKFEFEVRPSEDPYAPENEYSVYQRQCDAITFGAYPWADLSLENIQALAQALNTFLVKKARE